MQTIGRSNRLRNIGVGVRKICRVGWAMGELEGLRAARIRDSTRHFFVMTSSTSIHEFLNGLTDEALLQALSNCCAAKRWVQAFAARRPYMADVSVMQAANEIWS